MIFIWNAIFIQCKAASTSVESRHLNHYKEGKYRIDCMALDDQHSSPKAVGRNPIKILNVHRRKPFAVIFLQFFLYLP